MAKTKTKFNPADYKEQQKKKLNVGYVPGFHYDIVYEEVEGHGFETVRENALVEDVIRYLDNKQTKYIGALVPNHDCLCIVCNSLAFKFLGSRRYGRMSQCMITIFTIFSTTNITLITSQST